MGVVRSGRRRRAPRQERSRATVDAILQAAARILVSDGYDDLQTNRVADIAGVSIGSLYEYFPNKDGLIVTLISRFAATLHNELNQTFSTLDGASLDQALVLLVRAAFSVYQRQPKLAAELLHRTPHLQAENPLDQIELPIRVHLSSFLGGQTGAVDAPSRDASVAIAVRSARRLIDDTMVGALPQDIFQYGLFEKAENEICALLYGYLKR